MKHSLDITPNMTIDDIMNLIVLRYSNIVTIKNVFYSLKRRFRPEMKDMQFPKEYAKRFKEYTGSKHFHVEIDERDYLEIILDTHDQTDLPREIAFLIAVSGLKFIDIVSSCVALYKDGVDCVRYRGERIYLKKTDLINIRPEVFVHRMINIIYRCTGLNVDTIHRNVNSFLAERYLNIRKLHALRYHHLGMELDPRISIKPVGPTYCARCCKTFKSKKGFDCHMFTGKHSS